MDFVGIFIYVGLVCDLISNFFLPFYVVGSERIFYKNIFEHIEGVRHGVYQSRVSTVADENSFTVLGYTYIYDNKINPFVRI